MFLGREGAGDHCEMGNRALFDLRVYDLLATVVRWPVLTRLTPRTVEARDRATKIDLDTAEPRSPNR